MSPKIPFEIFGKIILICIIQFQLEKFTFKVCECFKLKNLILDNIVSIIKECSCCNVWSAMTMQLKNVLFKEFIKNGYAREGGKKVWNIADRKFLYMTPKLAKSFLRLRNLEFYKQQVINREIALLHANAPTLSKIIGKESYNLIDVYCGDGKKACEFIRALGDKGNIRYCPVNVHDYLTTLALKNVKKENFKSVTSLLANKGDCNGQNLSSQIGKLRSSSYPRNVILLFGSVLSSYEINDYLFHLSRGMLTDDVLLIGNAIRKGTRLVNLDLYKEDVWNQWFSHLLKELGLNKSDYEYNARFGNSRVEMYYTMKNNKKISHQGKSVSLQAGDEILTAILYKLYPQELVKFCKMYFSNVKLVSPSTGLGGFYNV